MKWQRPALLWTAMLAAGLGLWAGHRLSPGTSAPAAPATASRATAVKPTLQVGDQLPALTLPDLAGQPLVLRDHFAGRPLLINVWASWCAPCVEEMPELARFAGAQGDNGVQVLGLALDTTDDVRGFLQQVPVDYPIVIETPGPRDASVQLGNAQGLLPYSVLFDAQGRMVKAKLGPFAHGEIDSWVK
ncbi:TlpA family protein disulfide reductase [Stenotrophomonas maltophilia]|uniref:TlpA family protein disulfide reductase n=1 Tax=Stenotrophomonas maltophilia group TaxID=995085 RepID=UPI0015DF41A2|nr:MULTISPECIES: TlpA disulfide reductase family protein [Stenotrophomonas maltophilia group]MBA0273948.1 TlpA family protein disulfide reductase [Stenotrophomonas maltophilia]MDT3491901.1 TlpA disulfide reductase family protein [Stenotrophomonas maltophilia group sp. msm4]